MINSASKCQLLPQAILNEVVAGMFPVNKVHKFSSIFDL